MNRGIATSAAQRFTKEQPMSDAEYDAFYQQQTEEFGIVAAASRAQEHGATLMVKSLVAPFYSVPYPEFAEQVCSRQADSAEHNAGTA